MSKLKLYAAFLPLVIILAAGCSRSSRVIAVETGTPDASYQSLGSLQVVENAKDLWDQEAGRFLLEASTLTLADTGERAEMFRKALKDRLAETASKKYGADAVIHVTYWPDPESESFPEGNLYARGEMIRYIQYPKAATTIKGS